MDKIKKLLAANLEWSRRVKETDPDFFDRLSKAQSPKFLWIGCSDSRVPASQIMDCLPGEVFVHRNIANVVTHTDINFLSVLQYAVDVLRVEDIIVCGHYGCGGVQAALEDSEHGIIDNWLEHIRDIRRAYTDLLKKTPDEMRHIVLGELNVKEQVKNVCQTTVVRNAWKRGQHLCVHGLIYDLHDGILKDLEVSRCGV